MKRNIRRVIGATRQKGGIGNVLLRLLGVPIPILILISVLRGCQ
jgi:hypothetical protein